MIDCDEWKTEKRHECTNMGQIKRLELWWQLYVTWLPGRDLRNFRPMDFCSSECTSHVGRRVSPCLSASLALRPVLALELGSETQWASPFRILGTPGNVPSVARFLYDGRSNVCLPESSTTWLRQTERSTLTWPISESVDWILTGLDMIRRWAADCNTQQNLSFIKFAKIIIWFKIFDLLYEVRISKN